MPDLEVTDGDLDTVKARLTDAAVATGARVSTPTLSLGSDVVAAALSEVDSVVSAVSTALSTAATSAATATANAAALLSKSDAEIAGAVKH